jgi:hypothetical protein
VGEKKARQFLARDKHKRLDTDGKVEGGEAVNPRLVLALTAGAALTAAARAVTRTASENCILRDAESGLMLFKE